MPYIHKERRKALWNESNIDYDSTIKSKGELNFLITELLVRFLEEKGLSYHTISDAINAAKDAAVELERRVLAPYEDRAKKKNGDVYSSLLLLLKKV